MGIEPHLMLKTIQEAHYQDGKELDKAGNLQTLAATLGLNEAIWAANMAGAKPFLMKEIQESQKLMGQLQISGFPTLIMEKDDQFVRLPHSSYYGKPSEWEAYLASLV